MFRRLPPTESLSIRVAHSHLTEFLSQISSALKAPLVGRSLLAISPQLPFATAGGMVFSSRISTTAGAHLNLFRGLCQQFISDFGVYHYFPCGDSRCIQFESDKLHSSGYSTAAPAHFKRLKYDFISGGRLGFLAYEASTVVVQNVTMIGAHEVFIALSYVLPNPI
jgi:hypothetical protein